MKTYIGLLLYGSNGPVTAADVVLVYGVVAESRENLMNKIETFCHYSGACDDCPSAIYIFQIQDSDVTIDAMRLGSVLREGRIFKGRNWNRDLLQWYRKIMKEVSIG